MSTEEHPFAALMAEYVGECLPLAEEVVERTLVLERRWLAGDDAEELWGPLKGVLHTVKGNSAMMGLDPLKQLAHALEDLVVLLGSDREARAVGAPLLARGAGLLADLVGGAAAGPIPAEVVTDYEEEARAFLAADRGAREPAREELREGDRRQTDRRAPRPTTEVTAEGAIATIRVDSARLDALLESFGEAMIAQAGLRDAVRAATARRRSTGEATSLEQSMLGLERTMKRLEGALMETRLLPLSTLFGRFTRQVRDLAHRESKQVRLEVAGSETRLDKTIIDRLGEPLVHLLTNAIIHGIGTPAEREAAGKPAQAVISIRAVQRSDRVLLSVSDDGRGIDPERILLKARSLGLAPAGENHSRAEILALAFLPGLSTSEQVSTLAGRGVGLDVVASSIRSLGGHVSVASEPGRGTTFTLRLPLTVAVLRSMLVEIDGERYALPLADVSESVRVTGQALHQVVGQGMLTWRGEVIPVHDGGAVLGGRSRAERKYCVVLRSGARHRGLLVDQLLGHHEVVVKALDPALGRPPAVAAATILGDGRVACILDTGRLGEGSIDPALRSRGAA